jgi:hypothetical protein
VNIGQVDVYETIERRDGSKKRVADTPRLILLVLLCLATVFGVFLNRYTEQPHRVLNQSLDKTRNLRYQASLEGSAYLGGAETDTYRHRQRYEPGKGILTPNGDPFPEGVVPFTAEDLLAALRSASNVVEQGRQDMYGAPTRHLSGSFSLPDDGDSTAHAFDLWFNMRGQLPVRIETSTIVRNAGVDSENEPVTRVIYVNVRYHDWQ